MSSFDLKWHLFHCLHLPKLSFVIYCLSNIIDSNIFFNSYTLKRTATQITIIHLNGLTITNCLFSSTIFHSCTLLQSWPPSHLLSFGWNCLQRVIALWLEYLIQSEARDYWHWVLWRSGFVRDRCGGSRLGVSFLCPPIPWGGIVGQVGFLQDGPLGWPGQILGRMRAVVREYLNNTSFHIHPRLWWIPCGKMESKDHQHQAGAVGSDISGHSEGSYHS